jgi:hypothetical protein
MKKYNKSSRNSMNPMNNTHFPVRSYVLTKKLTRRKLSTACSRMAVVRTKREFIGV